ncbi:MAG: OmpA family protein, partial [Bacteroidia bacterium]
LIVIKFRGMEEGELEFDPTLFIINYVLYDSIIQLRKDLDEIKSKIDQQRVIIRSDSLQPETSPTLRDTIHIKSITPTLKDDDTSKRNEQLKEQNEKITKLEKELSELRNAIKSTDNSQPKLSQVQAGTVEDLQQNIKELRAQLNLLSKTKPDSIIRDTIKIMQNNDTTLIIKEKPVFITQENKKIKELEANSELLNKKIDSLLTAGTTITGTTQDTSAINELNKEINIIKSQLNELVKKEGDVELKTKPGFDKQNIFFASNKYTIISRYNPILEQIVQTANEYKELRILLTAFTDASGDPKYNIYLAGKRAESVKETLINRGIDTDKILIKALGEEQNAAKHDPASRRVEVEFIIVK